MNIIIVDDDWTYLEELKDIVERICRENHIVAKVMTTDDPVSIVDEEKYKYNDVILLDIDMPEASGIDIASQVNQLKGFSEKPYIIFVTNRDGLVFEALKQQPYSFVRKSDIEDLAPCLRLIAQKLEINDTYMVKTGRGVEILLVHEIVFLEKRKNYVVFDTVGGEYKERTTIDEKYEDLKDYGFLKSNIGILINPHYISEINSDTIKLLDGRRLPLAKKYKTIIKKEFIDWMVKN